jgi:hypothetical protein
MAMKKKETRGIAARRGEFRAFLEMGVRIIGFGRRVPATRRSAPRGGRKPLEF